MARKLVLDEKEFQVNHIPLAESPHRVTVIHKSTGFASTAETPEEAWAVVLQKLTNHYKMQVIRKANASW